jgi:hypothetical protein
MSSAKRNVFIGYNPYTHIDIFARYKCKSKCINMRTNQPENGRLLNSELNITTLFVLACAGGTRNITSTFQPAHTRPEAGTTTSSI